MGSFEYSWLSWLRNQTKNSCFCFCLIVSIIIMFAFESFKFRFVTIEELLYGIVTRFIETLSILFIWILFCFLISTNLSNCHSHGWLFLVSVTFCFWLLLLLLPMSLSCLHHYRVGVILDILRGPKRWSVARMWATLLLS